VVQLYLTPPRFEGGPRLALRAFERLQLRAGERRELRFELGPRELSFVDRDGQRLVMPGDYRLAVGGGQPGTGAPGASAAFTITRAQALPR